MTTSRRETIEIGSSPYGEDCAQAGTEGYDHRAAAECQAFRSQIIRHALAAGVFIPRSVKLIAKSNEHDFGTYYELAVTFPEDDEKAAEAAYWIEGNVPEHWDAEARAELGLDTVDALFKDHA